MRFLLLVLAMALPAMTSAEEISFDPQPETKKVESVEKQELVEKYASELFEIIKPTSPSMASGIERDVEELFKRVEELERTKIDAAEAEEIAENVFKRLSLVVNKASGGQEKRTVMAKMSGGAVVPVELGPGESLAAISNPSTGRFMQLQRPKMVSVSAHTRPVESYQFDAFEIRQSSVQPNGSRQVGIQMMDCSTGTCKPAARSQPPTRSGFFGRR